MRLYLVRHGQSTNNALAISDLKQDEIELQRHHDPELTDIGVQQAVKVAEFLHTAVDMPHPMPEPFGLTKIYVSPMIRALNTAKPIAEATGINPVVWTDIYEIGGLFTSDGDGKVTNFPGLTRSELTERYPNYVLPPEITENGWYDVNHGHEMPSEFMGRAIAVALRLRKLAPTRERIALVAHAAYLDSLMKALLGQLPTHPDRLFYNHYNTGITRIDFAESKYTTASDHLRLHYLNRVDHLPPELRTW